VEAELLRRFTLCADRTASRVAGVSVKRTGKLEAVAQAIMVRVSGKADFIASSA